MAVCRDNPLDPKGDDEEFILCGSEEISVVFHDVGSSSSRVVLQHIKQHPPVITLRLCRREKCENDISEQVIVENVRVGGGNGSGIAGGYERTTKRYLHAYVACFDRYLVPDRFMFR